MLIDGHNGTILKEQPTPYNSDGKRPNPGNGPAITADLDGNGLRDHFFLTWGPNVKDIAAVGPDLSIRWQHRCIGGNGHGHHNAVIDIDGSGREAIYAGNELLSADGEVIWQQPEIEQRLLCLNGGHVDCTVMGYFAGPDQAPSITLASSSAGAITCDARTGKILAAHPQGFVNGPVLAKSFPAAMKSTPSSAIAGAAMASLQFLTRAVKRVSRFQAGFHNLPHHLTGLAMASNIY